MPDDNLLKHSHTHSYRLQMMFKLVVAQVMKTEYYMILDSDCVALWPIHVKQLLWQQQVSTSKMKNNTPSHQALYQLEERSDHAEWWPESEQAGLQWRQKEINNGNGTPIIDLSASLSTIHRSLDATTTHSTASTNSKSDGDTVRGEQ
ncbi:unnamed protein product [Rotaria sordida]|uniref:Uncharacterized protein n=1 Tax=Rotaria sordida TaxID=392033 RepID=A0A819UZ61_9BILA|nr:unnamed protein product [Rotaria sordida]CAF3942384.1 unnamed protein product [Rotaria sordida]CAF4100897.1 unnamed protein product [Rotaria sordida]